MQGFTWLGVIINCIIRCNKKYVPMYVTLYKILLDHNFIIVPINNMSK